MIIKKIILYILLSSFIFSGTDGTIRGRVLNLKGEPLYLNIIKKEEGIILLQRDLITEIQSEK